MSTQQPTGLAKIRQEFQSPAVINMFRDAIPRTLGKQADEVAKRFAKMTYAAISQNPQLQKCTTGSLVRAASISASLDLDIDARGLAYLVPYGSEANFQIGYLGLIELAYRSGKVKSITANVIYESEKDSVKIIRKDGKYTVDHPFSYDKPSGNIIAVYATAIVDGIEPQTVVLRADEVEFYRKKSKAPNSPAWKDFPEAMYKKTAIRQLAKFLPKSILEDFSRGIAEDAKEDYATVDANSSETIHNQAGSEVVTTTFEDEEPQDLPSDFDQTIENMTNDNPADNKAKAEEQKKKLAEAEKVKNSQEPDSLYICNACGLHFDVPKVSGKGATQVSICPNAKCLSKNITTTEDIKEQQS